MRRSSLPDSLQIISESVYFLLPLYVYIKNNWCIWLNSLWMILSLGTLSLLSSDVLAVKSFLGSEGFYTGQKIGPNHRVKTQPIYYSIMVYWTAMVQIRSTQYRMTASFLRNGRYWLNMKDPCGRGGICWDQNKALGWNWGIKLTHTDQSLLEWLSGNENEWLHQHWCSSGEVKMMNHLCRSISVWA